MRGAASNQGNHEVFLHMSNHYRRLYNAKCAVDTSPPHNYRKQQTSRVNLSDEDLINLITNDTKQPPSSYMGRICFERGQQQCRSRNAGCRPTNRNFCRKPTTKVPPRDIIDRHAQNFASPNKAFQPRILKTEAQSRLRDMRVYHPPSRRKKTYEQTSRQEEKWGEEAVSVELSDLISVKKITSSKESSRDSAYNGGISSGADTPEQASPVSDRYQVAASPAKSESIRAECEDPPTCHEPQKKIPSHQTSSIRDDAAYVHFVHNITEDVLARGIYSDRGLKQLFERHVSENEGKLNMDRMRKEITNLCRQLGIQDEDNCKGEMSTCMRSIEEMMDVMRTVHRSYQLVNKAIPVSKNTDVPENSPELRETSFVRTPASTFHSGVSREHINGGCRTASISQNLAKVGQPGPSEELLKESPCEICRYETSEEIANASCQTSRISVVSEGVGSFTVTIPEEDLERVMSEFVDEDSQQCGHFPCTKGMITEAAEEMIDRLDQNNILSTSGMKEDAVKTAAELVTYILDKAITYSNSADTGIQ